MINPLIVVRGPHLVPSWERLGVDRLVTKNQRETGKESEMSQDEDMEDEVGGATADLTTPKRTQFFFNPDQLVEGDVW